MELAAQDENTLRKWVSGLIRKKKKEMSQSAIAYFLNKVGTDMGEYHQGAGKALLLLHRTGKSLPGRCGCHLRDTDYESYL